MQIYELKGGVTSRKGALVKRIFAQTMSNLQLGVTF